MKVQVGGFMSGEGVKDLKFNAFTKDMNHDGINEIKSIIILIIAWPKLPLELFLKKRLWFQWIPVTHMHDHG